MGIRTIQLNLSAGAANNICALQSPVAGVIVLNGAAVSGGVATLDAPRRVLITSGTSDAAITFTVTGTGRSGGALSETVQGGTAVATTQDFKTVTGITHTGSVAGTLTVGTSGAASSEWVMLNMSAPVMCPIGVAAVVTGTINYTVEYTYDDPNKLAPGVNPAVYSITSGPLTAKTANAEAGNTFSFPVAALRLTQNSGTAPTTARMIVIQQGGA